MHQLTLTFESASPINKERLNGQVKRLFEYLEKGNTIHCFHPAMKQLRIGYLNSRTSNIHAMLKKQGGCLYRRTISTLDWEGNPTTCKEYSLTPFV